MTQQTAVEWLHDQLTSTWYDKKLSKEILEQAKQMEKEQIIDAYKEGMDYTTNEDVKEAEQYYNQTYNQ